MSTSTKITTSSEDKPLQSTLGVDLSEADLRFRTTLPLDKFRELDIGIAGLGATGRQVAILLNAIGTDRVVGADPDRIEAKNIGTQGWSPSDVGKDKFEVIYRDFPKICGMSATFQRLLNPWRTGLTRERWAKKVVFCCVDTMRARQEIWVDILKTRHLQGLWIDSRVASGAIRIVTIQMNRREDVGYYLESFYSDEQAFQGACTDRLTMYGAYIAAGLMVSQLVNWLNGYPVVRDFMVETLSMGTVRFGE